LNFEFSHFGSVAGAVRLSDRFSSIPQIRTEKSPAFFRKRGFFLSSKDGN